MKKLILLLFILLSFNLYSEEKQTTISTHPIVYARIKVKVSEYKIYYLRYDKISDIEYKIMDGIPTVFISYSGTVFNIIEIKGKELCEEFMRELENFNNYLKNPRTGIVL